MRNFLSSKKETSSANFKSWRLRRKPRSKLSGHFIVFIVVQNFPFDFFFSLASRERWKLPHFTTHPKIEFKEINVPKRCHKKSHSQEQFNKHFNECISVSRQRLTTLDKKTNMDLDKSREFFSSKLLGRRHTNFFPDLMRFQLQALNSERFFNSLWKLRLLLLSSVVLSRLVDFLIQIEFAPQAV